MTRDDLIIRGVEERGEAALVEVLRALNLATAQLAEVRAICDQADLDMARHKTLTTIAEDHRPCETMARSRFADRIRSATLDIPA